MDFHKNYEENGERKEKKTLKEGRKEAFFFITSASVAPQYTRIMYGHIGVFPSLDLLSFHTCFANAWMTK